METFPRERVLALLDLPAGRLRYWERLGLIRAGEAFTLHDLIALRAVSRLIAEGVPAVRVRAALRAMSGDARSLKKPLLEVRLRALGGQVVGVVDGLLIEPATGQRVLDLDGTPRSAVRELGAAGVEETLAWAMRHDLDPACWERAAAAYARVLEAQPERREALLNLGTLEFKRERLEAAEACYRRAWTLWPTDPVVLFNLANVIDERGRPAEALPHLLAAVEHEPRNPDARFNLGLLLDKLGRPHEARSHWRAYLELDATSEWAALARAHLQAATTGPPAADVIPLRRRARA